MEHLPRKPLHRETYSQILVRVSYQLVRLDVARNPSAYTHPPTGVQDLADRLRWQGFTTIYWTLSSAARWLACDLTMRHWRDELSFADRERAIHKRKPPRRR